MLATEAQIRATLAYARRWGIKVYTGGDTYPNMGRGRYWETGNFHGAILKDDGILWWGMAEESRKSWKKDVDHRYNVGALVHEIAHIVASDDCPASAPEELFLAFERGTFQHLGLPLPMWDEAWMANWQLLEVGPAIHWSRYWPHAHPKEKALYLRHSRRWLRAAGVIDAFDRPTFTRRPAWRRAQEYLKRFPSLEYQLRGVEDELGTMDRRRLPVV